MRRLLTLFSFYLVLGGLPVAASTPPSVDAIAALAQAARSGLISYRVPVTISGSVRNGLISVHVTMKGTEYYKAPDREALRMTTVPKIASGFKNTVTSIPPPAAWPKVYALHVAGTQAYGSDRVYVLTGPPRKPGNVASVTLLVDSSSYALDSAAFRYRNGSNLTFSFRRGSNAYRLPVGAAISAHFPDYRGNAVVTYGAYQTNVAISDSVFVPGK